MVENAGSLRNTKAVLWILIRMDPHHFGNLDQWIRIRIK
jgi:hypothetical protein